MRLITRKEFLVSVGVSPILLFLLWPLRQHLRASTGRDDSETRMVKDYLSTLLSDPDGARVIGQAYLDAYPDEADRTLLLKELVGLTPLRGPGDLRSHLAHRREQDFLREEVVVVKGWILAKSEARTAALTVLL